MRYFYGLLAIIAATLIVLKPELTTQIVATVLAVVGILIVLPE